MKYILYTFILLVHLNLSSNNFDYKSLDNFMYMCLNYNQEIPNNEQICYKTWLLYKIGN